MHDVFEIYLHALRQDRDDKTELSDRGALETLLNAAAKDATPENSHHSRSEKGSRQRRPGFQGHEAGHDPRLRRGQDHRRKPRSGFEVRSDRPLQAAFRQHPAAPTISSSSGSRTVRSMHASRSHFRIILEGEGEETSRRSVAAASTLLRGFFSTAPEGIGRSEQLALALATRAHFLRGLPRSGAPPAGRRTSRAQALWALREASATRSSTN